MHASEGASGFAYHCIGAHAMNFMGVTFIALFRKKKYGITATLTVVPVKSTKEKSVLKM